jgi:hypothetical protein
MTKAPIEMRIANLSWAAVSAQRVQDEHWTGRAPLSVIEAPRLAELGGSISLRSLPISH